MEHLDRPNLVHLYPGMSDDEFFKAVDDTGGWAHGFKFVSFYHAVEYKDRVCMFTNESLRTGWWTTVASADDYFWWKLSPERKAKELATARKQLIAQLR